MVVHLMVNDNGYDGSKRWSVWTDYLLNPDIALVHVVSGYGHTRHAAVESYRGNVRAAVEALNEYESQIDWGDTDGGTRL